MCLIQVELTLYVLFHFRMRVLTSRKSYRYITIMTNIQFFVLDKSILGCNFCFEVHYHLLLVIVSSLFVILDVLGKVW